MTNCKDCTHWNDTCTNKQSDCYGQSTNADNGCVWGRAGWISVQDRLPEEKLPVIVAFDKCFKMPDIAYRKNGEWWFAYAENLGSCESRGITARYWQPLPEPPREDELPMPESVRNDIYDAIARGENYDGKRVSIHHSAVGCPDKTKDE